jgi:putative methionine-R-sulfoxide reductase with GAF domain
MPEDQNGQWAACDAAATSEIICAIIVDSLRGPF